jgi:hypothetical protein
MTNLDFDVILKARINAINKTLVKKSVEYQRNEDPLHNFNRAAVLGNTIREKALWGFALKHYVSFLDMLDDVEQGKLPTLEAIDEKIGDLINYLILCEASLKDRHNELFSKKV